MSTQSDTIDATRVQQLLDEQDITEVDRGTKNRSDPAYMRPLQQPASTADVW